MEHVVHLYMKSYLFTTPAFRLAFVCLCLLGAGEASGKWFSRVVIDPGHGGADKGAYWGGVRESTLNLNVSKKLEYYLKKKGISSTLTRRSDVFLSLPRRAAVANRYKGAVLVSVHFNASTRTAAKGVETFYASAEGRKLASQIQRRMVSRLKVTDRGVRLGKFHVLMNSRCPAVLVECGFISNSRERMRSSTQWYQATCASSIADALVCYRKTR